MERFDFVNRAKADHIDRLYAQYLRDPRSLDVTWQAYFAGFEYASGRELRQLGGPSHSRGPGENGKALRTGTDTGGPATAVGGRPELSGNASIGIFDLVHSYLELGHFIVDLDP